MLRQKGNIFLLYKVHYIQHLQEKQELCITNAYTGDYSVTVFYCLLHQVALAQPRTDKPMLEEVFRDTGNKYNSVQSLITSLHADPCPFGYICCMKNHSRNLCAQL